MHSQAKAFASDPQHGQTLNEMCKRMWHCQLTMNSSKDYESVRGYRWLNVTMEAPFAPRDGAGALVFKGRMWLIGGWNPADEQHFPKTCTNDVWSTADGADWILEKPNTYGTDAFDPDRDWEGRHTAGYVVHDEKMWIVGGDPLQGHYQYDVWNSEDGKAWHHVNPGEPVPWGPRVLHHTFVLDGKIWILGGQTLPQFAPAEEVFYHDVWNTQDGTKWKKAEMTVPFAPNRGMIGGSAFFGDRMWLLGGGTYETPGLPEYVCHRDVWSTADGAHWERHTCEAPWRGRVYHDVAVFDDRLWVLEGHDRLVKNMNDVWFSSDGATWHQMPNTPWNPRHAASVFVYNDALWIVAGNNMESDVWKLVRTSGKAHESR